MPTARRRKACCHHLSNALHQIQPTCVSGGLVFTAIAQCDGNQSRGYSEPTEGQLGDGDVAERVLPSP